ncbi:helix-hairpin-helix domain-containing protein [Sphingomonas floccifaciens]|uniref:Helix-hairpin-helix domain-containing protein n=1 Tax=Sphingomonas floccifaciens TaxID=1844115 RepID=A0ABW4NDE4_9SPHN
MTSDASWLTTTNLILIAIGVVLAIIVIAHGAKLKRRRKAVETQIVDRADDAPAVTSAPRTTALDETPPPAPETEPIAVATPTPAPHAVAPSPPLAGDDTPVVATAAPFDPAPATVAADLATPPEPPATTGDDLTRLKGVGPKLAARLNDLGITTYAEIAALSAHEAEALDAQLGSFQGRMTRDRWIEQAGYLANDDRAGFEAAFGRL